MVGKQIINNLLEMWLPKLEKLVTTIFGKKVRTDLDERQWERDNKLDNCHTLYDGKFLDKKEFDLTPTDQELLHQYSK